MYGKTIGLRIRFLRDQRRLSEAALGKLVSLSEREIYEIEMGLDQIAKTKPYLLSRLADALGTTTDFILDGENLQDLPGERPTCDEIERMWNDGIFRSRDEKQRFIDYAIHSVRQRNNAKIPLSRLELENLLRIMRGADGHQLRF